MRISIHYECRADAGTWRTQRWHMFSVATKASAHLPLFVCSAVAVIAAADMWGTCSCKASRNSVHNSMHELGESLWKHSHHRFVSVLFIGCQGALHWYKVWYHARQTTAVISANTDMTAVSSNIFPGKLEMRNRPFQSFTKQLKKAKHFCTLA